MIEGLLELILEITIEMVAELALELGFESVAHSLRGSRSANPTLAAVGLVIIGALFGFASSWLVPYRFSPTLVFSGISLLLAPLATGTLMHAFGSWRRARGGDPTYLASFWGGAVFAFAMSAVRWALVGRV